MNSPLRLPVAIALLLFSLPAFAEFVCKVGDVKAFETEMDRTIGAAYANFKNAEAQQQHALEVEADAMVSTGIWAVQDRAAFFVDMLEAPEFKDLERLKRETLLPRYMRALQGIAMTGSADDCERARDVLSTLDAIIAASSRQYEWAHARLKILQTSRNP